MRTFAMGDIHGAHRAMLQCFERSGFDYENDQLIFLGDVADGYDRVYECVEELLKIKNLIAIRGNHDEWFQTFIQRGSHPDLWMQGGNGTRESYLRAAHEAGGAMPSLTNVDIPLSHQKFFVETQRDYYKDDKGRIFVHGGFNREQLLSEQSGMVFYWDRSLIQAAMSWDDKSAPLKIAEPCTEIFIGHTTTTYWKKNTPIHAERIWNLDTGAGWREPLTIMDVDTHEYWQSDPTGKLYPNQQGR